MQVSGILTVLMTVISLIGDGGGGGGGVLSNLLPFLLHLFSLLSVSFFVLRRWRLYTLSSDVTPQTLSFFHSSAVSNDNLGLGCAFLVTKKKAMQPDDFVIGRTAIVGMLIIFLSAFCESNLWLQFFSWKGLIENTSLRYKKESNVLKE